MVILILLMVGFIIYLALSKKNKPQSQPKPEKRPQPQPVPTRNLRDDFNKQELARKKLQAKEREAYLSTIQDVDKSELEKYRGRRTRKTVRRIGKGFEFMRVSDTEDISRPGVYGIYAGSTLLYVGKSDRPIEDRLKEHAKSAKYPEEGGAQQLFLYKAMRENKDIIDGRVLAFAFNDNPSEIASLEAQLITTLNPICNIAR